MNEYRALTLIRCLDIGISMVSLRYCGINCNKKHDTQDIERMDFVKYTRHIASGFT